MKNKLVRDTIATAGLRQWQVADALGISEATFTRWLRKELPEDKKVAVLKTIEELKGVRGGG